MKISVPAETKDNVSVSAIRRSDSPASIRITFKDDVLNKSFGLETVGFEMSVESAKELVNKIEENIKWIEKEHM